MRNLMNLMALDEPTPSSAAVVDPGEPLFERLLTKYMDFFFGNLPEPKILTMYGSPSSSSATAPASLSTPSALPSSALSSSSLSAATVGGAVSLAASATSASNMSFLSSLVGGTSGGGGSGGSSNGDDRPAAGGRTTKVDSNIASTNIRQTYEFYEKYKALNSADDSRMRVVFLDIVLLFWTGQNGVVLSDIDATYARAGRTGMAANALPPRLDMVRIAERSVRLCRCLVCLPPTLERALGFITSLV
jgi:hypothetical protein